MTKTNYKPVVKYPGSKWRIADWIIDIFPAHHSYVEPFLGSAAVLCSKPPSDIETANDLDDRVYKLFKIIKEDPEQLARAVALTPYHKAEYKNTFVKGRDLSDLELVCEFLIQCWQGHGFRTSASSGWKNDIHGRERAYALQDWVRLPESIMRVAERLKAVQFTNEPAIELIKRFNHSDVLIYADPPYLLSTRHGRQYRHEMTDQAHVYHTERTSMRGMRQKISGRLKINDVVLPGCVRRRLGDVVCLPCLRGRNG